MNKITKTLRWAFLMMTCLLCIGAIQAQAATYTVNLLGDAGDGICDATCTLRDAVLTANGTPDDDVIVFSVTGTIILGSQIRIAGTGSLTINGGAKLFDHFRRHCRQWRRG